MLGNSVLNKGLSTITDVCKQILPIWQTCSLSSFSVIDDTFLSKVIIINSFILDHTNIIVFPEFRCLLSKNQTRLSSKDPFTKFQEAGSQYVKKTIQKLLPEIFNEFLMVSNP